MIRQFLYRSKFFSQRLIQKKIKGYKFSEKIMEQGKRTKEEIGERQETSGSIGGAFAKTKNPEYIQHRLELFEKWWGEQEEKRQALEKPEISITLPDGTVKKGKAFETTPMEIAEEISKGLAQACIAAKIVYTNRIKVEGHGDVVNPEEEEEHGSKLKDVYDMHYRFEGDCSLELIKFDSEIGKEVFWHSSAHVLGEALENTYGIHLTHGPPLELGFFYDFYMGNEHVSTDDFKEIESAVNAVVKKNKNFRKLILTKEQALEMFKHNPFKLSFINSKIPQGAATSVYNSGNFVDLCPGPHVPNTGKIKAVKLTKCSATNWLGDVRNDPLQRVYGVSFPSKNELKEYIRIQEEMAARDHRNIGPAQKLFQITKYSPGSPSFLPHGTIIFNKLIELIKKEYWARGFKEVNTPCINMDELWKTSGHYFKYKQNMFSLTADDGHFGMKPMNCPGHCAIFSLDQKSYRDLPLRMADFGVLHRNELSGSLGGLTRVRKFQQDDAHIFCTEEQVMDEITSCLDFLKYVYGVFGFEYSLELSTRPPERVGSEDVWDKAEKALRDALDAGKYEYTIGEGEGAFYGPKIDIQVQDCFNRKHQLGTIQLDFNLPERFNLQYRSGDGGETSDHMDDESVALKIDNIKRQDVANMIQRADKMNQDIDNEDKEKIDEKEIYNYEVSGKLKHGFKRPIMIHRAILGSLERCFAILTEVYGGKWPFWLSPRQAKVIPVTNKFDDYAISVAERLHYEGFHAEADLLSGNVKKKVRNAQIDRFNYILVVGAQEVEHGTATVRVRDDDKPIGEKTIDEIVALFKSHDPEESNAWKELKRRAFWKVEKVEEVNENEAPAE